MSFSARAIRVGLRIAQTIAASADLDELLPLLPPAQQHACRASMGFDSQCFLARHDGRIAGYEGADRIFQKYHDSIIDSHLPPPGTPTQPVEAGFMANAWLRMRHPDYDALREIMDDVGRTLKVRASA